MHPYREKTSGFHFVDSSDPSRIIHGMFVSGGALLVIYATQVLKEKEEFRATVAPVWVVLNFF